jgi:acyl-coenzyme A thioesterase PaaI-like protein
MTAPNQLTRSLAQLDKLPGPIARQARTMLLRNIVRFVGTARLDIEELTASRAVVHIKNRKRVQNHIGSVHAAAMALVAETASGFVVGMNVQDSCAPVIKSMHVDYKKRAKGGITAEATLTEEQIETIRTTEKGDVRVAVRIKDDSGNEPVECEMVWAWTPKRR